MTNRWPRLFTKMACGYCRAMVRVDPPISLRGDGSQIASSMYSVLAPSAIAAASTSPVLPGLPHDHWPSLGWVAAVYLRRISALRSYPPAASSTPRRPRISTGAPSRTACTPTTRPSSTARSSTALSSQMGTPWSSRIFVSWPANDFPLVNRSCPRSRDTYVRSTTRAVVRKDASVWVKLLRV